MKQPGFGTIAQASGRDQWPKAVSVSRNTRRTFAERLEAGAIKFKDAAEKQPPGSTARELLFRRARQAETAACLSDWLGSRELPAEVRSVGEQDGWLLCLFY